MGYRKYPILDEDAELRLLGACRTPEERGIVKILLISGMHISSCVSLTTDNIKKRGSRCFLEWSRTKTRRGGVQVLPRVVEDEDEARGAGSDPKGLPRRHHGLPLAPEAAHEAATQQHPEGDRGEGRLRRARPDDLQAYALRQAYQGRMGGPGDRPEARGASRGSWSRTTPS